MEDIRDVIIAIFGIFILFTWILWEPLGKIHTTSYGQFYIESHGKNYLLQTPNPIKLKTEKYKIIKIEGE